MRNECVRQTSGLVLYETVVKGRTRDPSLLAVPGLADRGYLFLAGRPAGLLSRATDLTSLPLATRPGQQLAILVENQGRVCFGPGLHDPKGILGNVTLGGTVLRGWRITSFPLDRPARLQRYTAKALRAAAASPEERVRLDAVLERTAGSLTIWAGEFLLAAHQLRDTFLALPGWGKGVAFINQLHLGRYWPVVGPQQTLYVPRSALVAGRNRLVVVELERVPPACLARSPDCTVELVDTHIIDGETPPPPSASLE